MQNIAEKSKHCLASNNVSVLNMAVILFLLPMCAVATEGWSYCADGVTRTENANAQYTTLHAMIHPYALCYCYNPLIRALSKPISYAPKSNILSIPVFN